jgi:hypothetical protein
MWWSVKLHHEIYCGQSFEIAANQIQKLGEAPFSLIETIKQETTHG